MRKSPPTRALREHPDLDQLKRQAKELLDAFTSGAPDAVREVNAHYHAADRTRFALHDAQLVLARAYGLDSWPKLKAYVDGVTAGRLCDAVENGDRAAVRDLLVRRPEIVNLERPKHGEQRAIHVAVLRRDAEMVKLLMEHGADARAGIYPHRDASSALTLATERGYDEIAAIIHQAEARRQGGGSEPDNLDWCTDEDLAIARFEADPRLVHERDPDGWTMLHAAAGMLQTRAVSWLLAHGADIHQRAEGEWTPLDYAASGDAWPKGSSSQGFAAVARLLLDAGAQTSSVSAVALGDAQAVRTRHAQGALVTATVHDVFRPFGGLVTIAVLHDRADMVQLLQDLGLDPDDRMRVAGSEEVSYSWGMPLYRCAEAGKLAMAEMLLARGADPNGEICASGTPVGRAFGARDWAMVQLLERYGGVVYAANAGYYRDTELARRLCADEDAGHLRPGTVKRGSTLAETLLDSGASGGDPEIVRMALARIDWPREDRRWGGYLRDPMCFWNHMPRIPTANPALDRTTYLDCFRQILNRCDPNVTSTQFAETPLHAVAAMGAHVTDEEVASFAMVLLDAGACLDLRDKLLRSTPLGWACRWGRYRMVRLLIERGANAWEPDAEPWATPRAWALKMHHDAILEVLPALA